MPKSSKISHFFAFCSALLVTSLSIFFLGSYWLLAPIRTLYDFLSSSSFSLKQLAFIGFCLIPLLTNMAALYLIWLSYLKTDFTFMYFCCMIPFGLFIFFLYLILYISSS